MRIWLYAARSGNLGLPFVCPACDCCPWAALELTEGTGPSRSHSDRQGQRACALGAAPGCRVCPVFPHHLDVLLIICQTGDVTRWGAVATAGNIGSWKGPLSRGPSRHLGRSPGAKGGKSKLPFRLLSSAGTRGASGTRPNCVISAPKAKHVVIQSKEALPKLQPPSCIIYYDCG